MLLTGKYFSQFVPFSPSQFSSAFAAPLVLMLRLVVLCFCDHCNRFSTRVALSAEVGIDRGLVYWLCTVHFSMYGGLFWKYIQYSVDDLVVVWKAPLERFPLGLERTAVCKACNWIESAVAQRQHLCLEGQQASYASKLLCRKAALDRLFVSGGRRAKPDHLLPRRTFSLCFTGHCSCEGLSFDRNLRWQQEGGSASSR